MMGTGIVLTGLGAIGLFTGAGLYAAAIDAQPIYCEDGLSVYQCDSRSDSGEQAAGGVLMGVGLAMVAVGIPLIVVGGKRIPARTTETPAAISSAEVLVGAGRGSLRFQF